jgi:hypothetical protein
MRVSFTDMREMCCCGPGARAPLLIVLSFVAIRPTGAFISTTDHAHVASRALAGLRRSDPSANVLFATDHDEPEDGDQAINIHQVIREVHRQVSSKNSSPLGSVFDGLSSSPFGSALDGYACGSGPFGLARIGLGSLPLSSMLNSLGSSIFGGLGSSPFGTAFDGHDSLQLGSAHDGLGSSPLGTSALDGVGRVPVGSLPMGSLRGCFSSSPLRTAFDGHLPLSSALNGISSSPPGTAQNGFTPSTALEGSGSSAFGAMLDSFGSLPRSSALVGPVSLPLGSALDSLGGSALGSGLGSCGSLPLRSAFDSLAARHSARRSVA